MDTAGKAVLFSGITVLVSLSAVMLVPSPAFRSMALGIMISVAFILAATLTLLPAVLAKLGPKVDRFALPWAHSGEHRSARFAAWGERLWRRPVLYGLPALLALLVLAIPVLGLATGMPSIKVVPSGDSSRQGYDQVSAAFGPGAPGTLQLVGPAAIMREAQSIASADPGIARVTLPQRGGAGLAMVQAVPATGPSDVATGQTIDRLRAGLPAGVLVGGAAAENHDLAAVLSTYTPIVIGVVLLLGFVLLIVALQAPVVAAIGVLTSLLATGAAFGVARLVFQDGHLSGLLGFESQGFLDAWGPVFFFAMIFAISMDYTVFLLSSAKEHWDRSHDPKDAAVGGMAHSGRVILAAAAVMVAVFFTFALSGPLPPKEMGVILGVAVLLDALLVRLLLVPVALRLAGRWAWWRPEWLAPPASRGPVRPLMDDDTTTTEVPMSRGSTAGGGGLELDFRHEAPDAYRALAALTRASTLDHGLAELMKVRASQINGCAYCVDLHVGIALKAGEHQRRLHAIATWRESPFFTDRERAALALTEALTRMDLGAIPDAVLSAVGEQFEEEEKSQLVVVIAGINAWNRVMAAAGDQPPPID